MRQRALNRIGDEIELAYGKALPSQLRELGNVPVFGSNGIIGTHNQPAVDGPGVIVGRKGSVGEIAYSNSDFWPIDTTYFVVRKRPHNWRYLFHLLRSVELTKLNSHSAVPGLNREDVYALCGWFPAPDEQAAIAKVLDAVEAAAIANDALSVQAEALKRTAMRELFTKGLRGEAQKDTEIGPIPESWEPWTVLDLCEIQSGGTPRKSVAEYWVGDIPWASGKDLKVPTLHDTIDHVSQDGVDAGGRIAPADSVLVLVRGMGLAKDLPVAVISRPMAFNQDLKALVSRSALSGTYIRSAIYCAKDRLLSRIVPSAHGTMTLNLDDIETFKIPCPSDQAEVDEIVAVLDAIDRKIALHKEKRAVLEALFKSLLHKLMTGEVRVADLNVDALAVANKPEAA